MPHSLSPHTSLHIEAQTGLASQSVLGVLAHLRRADLLSESVKIGRVARARREARGIRGAALWRVRLGAPIVRFGAWLQGAGGPLASPVAGRRDFA
jgi:hypothetical protein